MSPPPQFAQILVHRAAFPSPPQRFPSAQQAPPHPSGQQIEQIHITRAHGGALRGGPPRGAQARDDVRERALDASARSWDLNSPQSASRPENPLAPGFVFALQGLRRLLSRSAIVAQISQSGLYGGYHLASSGGVNTSSLERFAMHVRTSGLRLRKAKLAWSVIR